MFVAVAEGVEDNDGAATAPRQLPEWIAEFADVFEDERATEIPEHGNSDHAIELVDSKQPPYMPTYPLSERELATLREYLDVSVATGRI